MSPGALAAPVAAGALGVAAGRIVILAYGPLSKGGPALTLPVRAAAEAAAGIAFIVLQLMCGWSSEFIVHASLVALMLEVFLVDAATCRIPNNLVLAGAGMVVALGAAGLLPVRPSVAGALAGGGLMLAAATLGRGAMGAGDVKISLVIGGFVGWPAITVALFASFVAAAIGGLVLMAMGIKGRRDFIPFGPFLAAGALFAAVWGGRVVEWYWGGVVR